MLFLLSFNKLYLRYAEDSFNTSYTDDWLTRSYQRSDQRDSVYEPTCDEEEPLKLTLPKSCLAVDDRVYLVYENKLEELMKFCSKCGSPIASIDKKSCRGTQVNYHFTCLSGCESSWCSQPKLDAVKGIL